MNFRRALFTFSLVLVALPSLSIAQVQHYYPAQQVLPQPIYMPGTVINSPAICNPTCPCNPSTPSDCGCKCLDCKVCLKSSCKTTTPYYKTPLPCCTFGKVPISSYSSNCLEEVCKFQAETDVPTIVCASETCVEVGKKLLQCMPGCCFEVCVPKFLCKAETKECKLVKKVMPMELWKRTEKGCIVYDVIVINDKNNKGKFHAGGMPAKWVVMHCKSKAEVEAAFPGVYSGVKVGIKAKATPANIKLKMVVDKEKMDEHLKKVQKTKEPV